MTKPSQGINYLVHLKEPLEEIPKAIVRRIDDDHGSTLASIQKGLPTHIRSVTRLSATTWQSIRHLCFTPQNGEIRKEFAASVPPLTRTLIDTLFNLVYLFDEPAENTRRYYAAGWKNLDARNARLATKPNQDPDYVAWLQEMVTIVAEMKTDAELKPAEAANVKLIDFWPTPGMMVNTKNTRKRADGSRFLAKDPQRLAFLTFLNEEHYGTLSSASHVTLEGLAGRVGLLFGETSPESFDLFVTHSMVPALMFYVAILTEIVVELRFEHEQGRLRKVWEHIKVWPDAAELLLRRYAGLLGI